MSSPTELNWNTSPPSPHVAPESDAEPSKASFWGKSVAVVALFAGGLPLLVYPFIFLAGIMSLAGHRSGTEPPILVAVSMLALLSSILYPLVYVPCLIMVLARLRAGTKRILFSLAPLVYLVLVAMLFLLWFSLQPS